MLSYVIHSDDIEDVLEIIYDVLQIGVSFYDKDFNELPFISQGRAARYCSCRRKDVIFLAACKKCDKKYFDIARDTHKVQVYRCHAGLLDGIVPLFDDQGYFLGGLIFGQVASAKSKNPHEAGTSLAALYDSLPKVTKQKLLKIGRLLKLTTELIVSRHMIEFRKLGWAAQLQQYIAANIHTKITLDNLCELVGKSPSFLTHHFREEFGMSLSAYIKAQKMEKAMLLLKQGLQVSQVAQRLGYYDAYHFSKAFKQFYDKPPKDFINIVLEIVRKDVD